jgi:hypothetical protein
MIMVQWKKWMLLSLALNVSLAVVAVCLRLQHADPSVTPIALAPLPETHPTGGATRPEPPAESQSPEPVAKPFDWSQLESEDLRLYCARLRAVGCPERTIIDLLLPIIEESFGRRLRPLNANVPGSFWINGSQRAAALRQRDKSVREIQKEKAALIQELFGKPLSLEALRAWQKEMETGFFLGLLPEGKPEQVLCLARQLADQANEIRRLAQGILTPEDISQLSLLYDQGRTQLASILTASEMEELELRMTAIGAGKLLEQSVVGLEVTGPEIRAGLVNLMHNGNPVLRNLLLRLDPTEEEQSQLRQLIEQQLRPMLGETRFTHYQRMQDRAYRELFQFGEQNSVSLAIVSQVYEVSLAVKDEESTIRKRQDLNAQQRDAALALARQASEEAVRALLGAQVFEAWIKGRRP